jgi:hypothetical protein
LPRVSEKWYCAVKADKKKTKRIDKVYIPKDYFKYPSMRQTRLWGAGEQAIMDYLVPADKVDNPWEALRFSWATGMNRQKQMLIPATVVNGNNLELSAKCFDSRDGLKGFSKDVVNWNWDIKGNLGLQDVASGELASLRRSRMMGNVS